MKRRGFFSLLVGVTAAARLSSEAVFAKVPSVIKLPPVKEMTINDFLLHESAKISADIRKIAFKDYVSSYVGEENADKYFPPK